MDFWLLVILLAVSLIAGTLGCFLIWRRIEYFADALSHSLLFGVALSLLTGVDQDIAMMFVAVVFSVIAAVISDRKRTESAVMNITMTGMLTVSIFITTLIGGDVEQLEQLAFGSIYSLSELNLPYLILLAFVLLLVVYFRLHNWLLISINPDLAAVRVRNKGYITAYNAELYIIISLFIVSAVKFIGVLMASSLLVVPALTARLYSNSVIAMISASIITCFIACIMGNSIASQSSIPISAAVSGSCILIFVLSLFYVKLFSLMKTMISKYLRKPPLNL